MNTTFMTKADAAVALLTDKLRVSNVLDAAAITAEAKAKGIGRGTLQRAKTVLGLQARRQGFSNGGKWFWVDYSITAPAAADAAADTPNPGDSAVLIPLSILPLYKLIQQAEHMLIDNDYSGCGWLTVARIKDLGHALASAKQAIDTSAAIAEIFRE